MSSFSATTLIVKAGDKAITVTLREPMSLHEIRKHFVCAGLCPDLLVCTLARGVAQVIFRP
jgi:hypothetical protein